MRGPARRSAEMELRRGNPGKRSRRKLEAAAAPTTDPQAIAPPEYLSEAVKKIWQTYINSSVGQSILKAGDLPALERMCTYLHEWRVCTFALHDHRTPTGLRMFTREKRTYGTVTKIRPEFTTRQGLEDKIRALEAKFGATPSDRARVMHGLADIRDPVKPPLSAPPGSQSATGPAADGIPDAPSSPIGTLGAKPRLN